MYNGYEGEWPLALSWGGSLQDWLLPPPSIPPVGRECCSCCSGIMWSATSAFSLFVLLGCARKHGMCVELEHAFLHWRKQETTGPCSKNVSSLLGGYSIAQKTFIPVNLKITFPSWTHLCFNKCSLLTEMMGFHCKLKYPLLVFPKGISLKDYLEELKSNLL